MLTEGYCQTECHIDQKSWGRAIRTSRNYLWVGLIFFFSPLWRNIFLFFVDCYISSIAIRKMLKCFLKNDSYKEKTVHAIKLIFNNTCWKRTHNRFPNLYSDFSNVCQVSHWSYYMSNAIILTFFHLWYCKGTEYVQIKRKNAYIRNKFIGLVLQSHINCFYYAHTMCVF